MPLRRAINPLLSLPRGAKVLLVALVDTCSCFLAVWLALYLRLGEFLPLSGPTLWAAVVSVAVAVPVFFLSGLYLAIFRYAGEAAVATVARATFVHGVVFASIFTAIGVDGVPRTVGLIAPILLLLMVGASRASARFGLGGFHSSRQVTHVLPTALVFGAGTTGRQFVAAVRRSHFIRIVGFLDDDTRLHGRLLDGLPVYAPGDLPSLVGSLHVTDVLLAVPSTTRQRRNEILEQIAQSKVSVRTLPSFADLVSGQLSFSDLKDLDCDDLLGREPVSPIPALMEKNVLGRVVLVTGAGGSIGSELCRQILSVKPATLLLVEQSEFSLYQLHEELRARADRTHSDVLLVPLLTSIRDAGHMGQIFSKWKPETVYHAAAYKHVPLVEHNVVQGIENNLLGTLTLALAASEHGVSDFILISTDKAVRPTNVMGASKRLAEMVLQALAANQTGTTFAMVRFGNVLGSSGSVVPKFRQQLRDGGPITLTHPEITRFFMTIPEAAQLVIQAGAMAEGGDVFVLDMGKPVKIYDLATRIIELSGLTLQNEDHPTGDIPIHITGLRPGEKLHEELLIGNDPKPTQHPRILRATERFLSWSALEERLLVLQDALDKSDIRTVRLLLEELVSGFKPDTQIVDWLYEPSHENEVRAQVNGEL